MLTMATIALFISISITTAEIDSDQELLISPVSFMDPDEVVPEEVPHQFEPGLL